MFRTMSKILGVLALFSMIFLIAGNALASTKVGTLYTIDTKTKHITLKNGGILNTFKYSAKTNFIRNGISSNAKGLVIGDSITAVFRRGLAPAKVKAIGIAVTTIKGMVTGVSSSAGTIKVGTQTLQTTFHTEIIRNGDVSHLDSVALDDNIVAHEDEQGEIEDVEVQGPEDTEIRGTITAVDTVNNKVTIDDGAGNVVTVNVTANTVIELNDTFGTISDLTSGLFVEAQYDSTTFEAFRINVEDMEDDAKISGTITAVDTVNGSVTIDDGAGTVVTVFVNASTSIQRDDLPAFLGDLQVGDKGKAEYNSSTMVATEVEAES